ncbi:hypothetical protein R5R35_006676 [Gryllus longicercus]|uniref:Protein takeout-like n=1 Tax=Gryllus longicercus TaxID=2509291 RepID=A0AAN9VU62_9ORTH
MAAQPLLLPLLLLVASLHSLADAAKTQAKFPPYIHKCSIKDPNLEQCALEAGRVALPHLVKGNPQIRLPSLDPLSVTEVRVQSGNQLDMHCRNIVLKGLANTELLHIGIDLKNKVYSCICRIPRLEISGDYTVDGRVLILPIKGNGKAVFTFDDAVMYYQQKYDLEKKGDRYYLKFPDSSATFNCSKAHFTMDNLFNGDKQLGNTLNNFLNENWRAVVDDLGQPFVDAAAQVIRQFALAIVGNVPYDEIFEDVELPQ